MGSSLLMWECGLILVIQAYVCILHVVTPYVGVWIETDGKVVPSVSCDVTPYVGVWIETSD